MTLFLFAIIVAFQVLHIATDIRAARSLSRSTVLYARALIDGNEVDCACRLSEKVEFAPCYTGCQIVRVLVDGRRKP